MARIRQSVCFWCFCRGGATAEQVIDRAAAIGYESVEMAPREHWDRIRDRGLGMAVIVGHASLADGLNDPANHDRIEDELTANIELAAARGIPGLICFSGNRRGRADAAGRDHCIAGLQRVAGAAEEKGVTLCLELLNSKVDHADYQCDRTAWGVEVCRGVGSPRVKLLYDIYHMQIMEGDLIRTIRESIDWIGHFHTAGNPGRRDMDEDQEICYPPLMRAISGSGYGGYVGHEFVPKGDPLQALQQAYDRCRVDG
ncbi:MAG: TIM barrel protein [Gemmatimonadota bacterium]